MNGNKSSYAKPFEGKTYKQLWRFLLKLSKAEGSILLLIAEGKSNKEIDDELYLSPRTVENHCYRIRKKLDLNGNNITLREWGRNVQSVFSDF